MKTSRDFEREFLESILQETGRDIHEWMDLIDILPEKNRENIILHMQQAYKVTFRQATLLAAYYQNGKKPRYD